MLNVTARKKEGDQGSLGGSGGGGAGRVGCKSIQLCGGVGGGAGVPAPFSEVFKTMVWKWASEQIEHIGALLWKGVTCGHFIYSFNKQVSPHCMPDTALGIRDEAIIEREKVPALLKHTFWYWGGRAGSKEKARCMVIKHVKCC